ncbi:MAG: Smr/MutS family protein [Spirochaetota bacterium]
MNDDISDPVEIELGDIIDLHMFHPRDAKAIVEEFIHNAVKKGITPVIIIHGKGKSVLKQTVHQKLAALPMVKSFKDAGSNWGATEIELKIDKGET